MLQQNSIFPEWYPKIKDQAARCVSVNYIKDMASRDMILIQTSNTMLQKKIITKDLSYKDTVKYGLAMEQSHKIVKELGRNHGEEEYILTALESQVQKLQSEKLERKKIIQVKKTVKRNLEAVVIAKEDHMESRIREGMF